MRVGVISDTHGLLRREALEFLKGSALIIHCGDICDPAVIKTLSRLAPVQAVRGNNDKGSWADELPESQTIRLEEVLVYVIHDLAQMRIDPAASGVGIVLCGHSHKPAIVHRDGVTYLNPGSAGPRRFKLPISVAEMMIDRGAVVPRIVELENSNSAGR